MSPPGSGDASLNLLLFTVELERTDADDQGLPLRTGKENSPLYGRVRLIAIAVPAVVCRFAAITAGWVIGGGGTVPIAIDLPD
jgi:hypothetical protein